MLCRHAGDDFMPQMQAIGNWTFCADSLAFAVIAHLHPESARMGFLRSPALNDNARAERGVSQGIFYKISQRNLQQHRLTGHGQRGFCLYFDHVTSLPCSLRIVGGHGACQLSQIDLLPSRLCTAPTRPCQGQQLVQYMARPQCVSADTRQCGALRLGVQSCFQRLCLQNDGSQRRAQFVSDFMGQSPLSGKCLLLPRQQGVDGFHHRVELAQRVARHQTVGILNIQRRHRTGEFHQWPQTARNSQTKRK